MSGLQRDEQSIVAHIGATREYSIPSQCTDSLDAWEVQATPSLSTGYVPDPHGPEVAGRNTDRDLSWQLRYPLGPYSTNPLHPPSHTPSQYSYTLTSWNALDTAYSQPFPPRSTVSVQSPPAMNSMVTPAADLQLRCNGNGCFSTHRAVLLSASSNHFNHLLTFLSPRSMHSTLTIDDDHTVMYVIVDAIYAAFPMYKFTSEGGHTEYNKLELPLLIRAVERMTVYGVRPSDFIHSSSQLYARLCQLIPFHPLNVFTLAAQHKIEALAVQASSHLLSLKISAVPEECRQRIGPEYLNRLLSLHRDRLHSLKLIVAEPPNGHPFTLLCTNSDQMDVVELWKSGMSMVQRNATPDLSPQYLVGQMRAYHEKVDCVSCSNLFGERLSDVAEKWSKVKCTI